MNPKYPVYIISKGRWESRLTNKALERMNVPYHIVIEPQEFNDYARVIDEKKILVLPFSNLGKGSIPEGIKLNQQTNNYGMILVNKNDKKASTKNQTKRKAIE